MDINQNNGVNTFLIIGIGLLLLALPLRFAGTLSIEEKEELFVVNGNLEKFHITSTKDGKRYMRLEIISGKKWFSLLQDDLSWKYPELKSYKKGATVIAKVTERCCAPNLKTLWELNINNAPIFNYENIIAHKKTVNNNGKKLSIYSLILGFIVLAITITIKLTRRSSGTNNP